MYFEVLSSTLDDKALEVNPLSDITTEAKNWSLKETHFNLLAIVLLSFFDSLSFSTSSETNL